MPLRRLLNGGSKQDACTLRPMSMEKASHPNTLAFTTQRRQLACLAPSLYPPPSSSHLCSALARTGPGPTRCPLSSAASQRVPSPDESPDDVTARNPWWRRYQIRHREKTSSSHTTPHRLALSVAARACAC
jgi:hypothetical protein